jgi:hypothetical protein
VRLWYGETNSLYNRVITYIGGITGALFASFATTIWANAIEAEVYGMSTAFMGFMTWLALKWGDLPKTPRSTSIIYLVFYLLALSVGFHLGTVLVFSGIFFFVSCPRTPLLGWSVVHPGCGAFIADATGIETGRSRRAAGLLAA